MRHHPGPVYGPSDDTGTVFATTNSFEQFSRLGFPVIDEDVNPYQVNQCFPWLRIVDSYLHVGANWIYANPEVTSMSLSNSKWFSSDFKLTKFIGFSKTWLENPEIEKPFARKCDDAPSHPFHSYRNVFRSLKLCINWWNVSKDNTRPVKILVKRMQLLFPTASLRLLSSVKTELLMFL